MKLGKLLAAGKSIMNGRAEVSYRSSKQIYLPKFGSSKNPFKSVGAEAGEQAAETAQPDATVDRAPVAPTPTARPTRVATRQEAAAIIPNPALGDTMAVQPDLAPASHPKTAAVADSESVGDNASLLLSGPENLRVLSHPQPSAGGDLPVKPAAARVSNPPAAVSNRPSAEVRAEDRRPSHAVPRINALVSMFRAALPVGKAGRPENTAKGQRGAPTQTELSLDAVKVVHNDLSDVDVEVVPIKSRAGAQDLPAPKKSWEYVGERLFGVEAT